MTEQEERDHVIKRTVDFCAQHTTTEVPAIAELLTSERAAVREERAPYDAAVGELLVEARTGGGAWPALYGLVELVRELRTKLGLP